MARKGTVCHPGSSRIAARLSPTNTTQMMSARDDRARRSLPRTVDPSLGAPAWPLGRIAAACPGPLTARPPTSGPTLTLLP
jgi:hypothetical protein